jgi:hypothetical protein
MSNYKESNKYKRRDTYDLKQVDIEPFENSNKVPECKSIVTKKDLFLFLFQLNFKLSLFGFKKLGLLVEKQNFSLLSHPVIGVLIKKKWKEMGR